MIAKSRYNNNYIGPKALFDPNYIPPKLLYRKKDEDSLFSILNDSISDEFCLNILFQGIQGVGKKAIINTVTRNILNQNKEESNIQTISIDCKEKKTDELIITLLSEMNKFLNLNLNFETVINSKISHLWSMLKLASNRLDINLILIFNNIEYLKPEIFKKFLRLGKEINTTIISTINKLLRPITLDMLNEFDFKKNLSYFSYKELYYILKQRASLTFLHEIDAELLEFIIDLIFEHYIPVPGKGVDILRELYPFLKNQKSVGHFEMMEVCKNQFDTFQPSDEFNMLNYISEEDILTILFLDNLSNYFLKKSNFYISYNGLKELYNISCETLRYEKDTNEFNDLIKKAQNVGILSFSKKNFDKKDNHVSNNALFGDYYFMIINPNDLKIMVDAVFGKI